MSILAIVALVVFLTIPEGISQVANQRCRCISKEKKPIGRYIGTVKVHPANSHCEDIEIIATLKKNGTEICLDPEAPWVKKVLARAGGRQEQGRERGDDMQQRTTGQNRTLSCCSKNPVVVVPTLPAGTHLKEQNSTDLAPMERMTA